MRQLSRILCIFLGSMIALVGASTFGQGGSSCDEDEARRALDFWIGEWEVVDEEGQPLGTNRIEASQNGCLIRERWESARGGSGQSVNYFDPAEGVWKQNWVDSNGGIVDYTGGVEGGVLRYEGRHVRPDGTVLKARVVIEPLDDGRLHHLTELSSDGGANWSPYFDGTYLPRGGQVASATPEPVKPSQAPITEESAPQDEADTEAAAAAAAAATVASMTDSSDGAARAETEPQGETPPAPAAPAPEPHSAQPQATRQTAEEGSSVRAVTRELQREEIPVEQAPELVMASPMVLEVEPADIYRYPENAAWRTDETAGFICNEVKIKRVGVGHSSKGNAVDLTVTPMLYTKRRIRRADLLVEIVDAGKVVASTELRNIRVGKNIPAHGNVGMDVAADVRFSREQFEALFAGTSRPTIRLTLTVP